MKYLNLIIVLFLIACSSKQSKVGALPLYWRIFVKDSPQLFWELSHDNGELNFDKVLSVTKKKRAQDINDSQFLFIMLIYNQETDPFIFLKEKLYSSEPKEVLFSLDIIKKLSDKRFVTEILKLRNDPRKIILPEGQSTIGKVSQDVIKSLIDAGVLEKGAEILDFPDPAPWLRNIWEMKVENKDKILKELDSEGNI